MFELNVGAKVTVIFNFNMQDMLINGQVGEVVGFEIKNSIVQVSRSFGKKECNVV